MTVSSQGNRTEHVGSGTSGPFAFNWLVHNEGDLTVTKRLVDGTEVSFVVNVDFTITGLGDPVGGTISTTDPVEVGELIVLERIVPNLQELDLNDDDDFPADSIERQLDRIVMMIQRSFTLLGRALILGVTDTFGSGAYDAGGNRIKNLGLAVEDNDAATLSQMNAAVSSAAASAAAAATSATNAANSATAAATSAGHASGFMVNASNFKDAAEGFAEDAADAADLAERWANEAEDVEIEPGLFSAFHWAQKAAEIVLGDINASHVHFQPTGDLVATNVQSALAELDVEKASVIEMDTKLAQSANLSDVADVGTARDNLGLGDLATVNSDDLEDLGALPIGAVIEIYEDELPNDKYVWANGQNLSRTHYAALFARWGTRFGEGDGSTTFGVPDKRGRVAAGKDDMGGVAAGRLTNTGVGNPGIDGTVLGATGGADRHQLTAAQLAQHFHVYSRAQAAGAGYSQDQFNPPGSVSYSNHNTETAGSNQAHPNAQPTIIANFVIYTGVSAP